MPREAIGFQFEFVECQVVGVESDATKPLVLFGIESTTKVGLEDAPPYGARGFSGSLELTLSEEGYGARVSTCGHRCGSVSAHFMGFYPFNLDPFIFGPGVDHNSRVNGIGTRRKNNRKSQQIRFLPPGAW